MDWYVDGAAAGAMTALRHEIRTYLRRHSQSDEGLDEAELVVSEVTGNAVRHASGPVWVSLTWREVFPRLTVRDLGPGFDTGTLSEGRGDVAGDPDPTQTDLLAEGGRGLFLITHLAHDLSVSPGAGAGTVVTATLPVKRRATLDHDPPRSTRGALPDLSEASAEGGFEKEAFLRALVVQLARTVEYRHGPDAADAAVAQVGADVGGQMEAEYRAAARVVGAMTPEQMAQCYVRLKHAIDGGFYVVEMDDTQIVLGNTACPFGEAVQRAPSLCRMTSSVFGGIAARNTGHPVAVLLEERIAVGDPGCRVVVALSPDAGIDRALSHRYAPPQDETDPRRAAEGRAPD